MGFGLTFQRSQDRNNERWGGIEGELGGRGTGERREKG